MINEIMLIIETIIAISIFTLSFIYGVFQAVSLKNKTYSQPLLPQTQKIIGHIIYFCVIVELAISFIIIYL